MKKTKSQNQRNTVEYDTWDNILKENKEIDLIISKEQMVKLLERIGDTTDDESFIIDKKTGERELAIDSAEIKSDEIGAVLPGSKVFIKKNLAGFSHYLSEYCD